MTKNKSFIPIWILIIVGFFILFGGILLAYSEIERTKEVFNNKINVITDYIDGRDTGGAEPLGLATFRSVQLAGSPQADYILSTDGSSNSWIVNSGGGAGGSGVWSTSTDDQVVYNNTGSAVVIEGTATTSAGIEFEVNGDALFDSFVSQGSSTVTGALTVTGGLVGNADTVTTNANLTGDVTSTGNAAIIAAGVIIEPDLNTDNAAVDGDILVYDSTGTNFTWQTCAEITGSADLCDGTDATGGGGDFAWTPSTTYGETANATATPIWLQDTLYASSTAYVDGTLFIASKLEHIADSNTYIQFADDQISYITGASTALIANADGAIYNPVNDNNYTFQVDSAAGDYALFMYNNTAESSLRGFIGIGTSTPKSQLTVDGTFAVGTNGVEFTVSDTGQTTIQGQLSASSTATSTFAQGIDIDAGCFAIGGTCLSTGGLASTDIDTYSELNTIVADVTLTHNGLIDTYSELNTIVADVTLTHNGLIDTFSELDTIVANKSLANLDDAQTFASLLTLTSGSISNASSTVVGDFTVTGTPNLGTLAYPTTDGNANEFLQTDGAGNLSFSTVAAGSADALTNTVYNATGVTITKGSAVYISGFKTGNNVPQVTLADADAAGTMPAYGLASADIINNSEGEVIISGEITGLDTSAYSIGDALYVSGTAGELTATKPSGASQQIQKVAIVTRVNVTLGVLEIFGAGRSNDVPNTTATTMAFTNGLLMQASSTIIGNFTISGGNLVCTDCVDTTDITDATIVEADISGDVAPVDGDFLQYDSTGANFTWRNATELAADIETAMEAALDTLTALTTVIIATVLEIPNAANPTVDAAGEIALDTTDNQLLVADSGNTARVIRLEDELFSFTVASTSVEFVSGGIIPLPPEKDGYDISQFRCYVDGGTSVVVNVSDGTNDTETITCATTLTSDTSVDTNSAATAGELMEIQIGTITGTPDYLSFTAYGHYTRE